jgi:hypothetical protein
MLQRTCDCGEHTGGGECEGCKKKKKMPLQRHANGLAAPAVAPPIVHDVLRSPGQPLDEDTQSHFTAKFRQDFSRVRVHTDEQAAESARAVGALAYTVGNNVVFGAGRYSPANSSGRRLLAHELTHVVQQQHESVPSPKYRLEIGPSQDRFEREADQLADRMASGMEASQEGDSNLSPTLLSLNNVAPRVQRAEAGASAAPAPSPAAAPLLVDDDARDTHTGQMRKGEFLDKLQVSVCATADEVLSSVGRSAQGCPYIERWIGHLRTKSSQFVERGIRKYAPQSAGVTKAQDYIPFVTARVRRGVMRWAQTGEITEVPDELKGQLMGANLLAAADRLLSGIGGAIGGAISAITGGVKKAASAIGGLFAKERDGGVRDAGDPHEIQAQLRPGHPLDAGVKSRMETAFGGDFSDVRAHTDSNAADLSTRLNARAFTVGRDVAFGAGEYQPGTLVGDALIAHELAHVMQQEKGPSAVTPMSSGGLEYSTLEEDADMSAAAAVVSLWGRVKEAARKTRRVAPGLRSGLRLQRCGAHAQTAHVTQPQQPASYTYRPAATPACPPALDDPAWRVSSAPTLQRVPGCNFVLGENLSPTGSRFGINGMEFDAHIRATPGCTGHVYFVQYVKPSRKMFGCVDSRTLGLCATHAGGVDTAWPYSFGSNANTYGDDALTIPIHTFDSPGVKNISGNEHSRVCINDEFVTYIVFEDGHNSLTPLGWMHWSFSAQAFRSGGACPPLSTTSDCTGWEVHGGGRKQGESFVAGNMGPIPLNRSAPIVTASSFSMSDCSESECPVATSGTRSPQSGTQKKDEAHK